MRLALAAVLATLGCAGLSPVEVGAGKTASEYRDPYTGETFVELCDDHTQAAQCGAYVEGARSGMRALRLLIGFQLDKAKLAEYVIDNTGDRAITAARTREVFEALLAELRARDHR